MAVYSVGVQKEVLTTVPPLGTSKHFPSLGKEIKSEKHGLKICYFLFMVHSFDLCIDMN